MVKFQAKKSNNTQHSIGKNEKVKFEAHTREFTVVNLPPISQDDITVADFFACSDGYLLCGKIDIVLDKFIDVITEPSFGLRVRYATRKIFYFILQVPNGVAHGHRDGTTLLEERDLRLQLVVEVSAELAVFWSIIVLNDFFQGL